MEGRCGSGCRCFGVAAGGKSDDKLQLGAKHLELRTGGWKCGESCRTTQCAIPGSSPANQNVAPCIHLFTRLSLQDHVDCIHSPSTHCEGGNALYLTYQKTKVVLLLIAISLSYFSQIWTKFSQSYHTAFAQHAPSCIFAIATTSALFLPS